MSGANGEKLDKNPLKDRRVRQALSIAINRQAIVDRVMEGAAVPSGQYLPPGVYSHAPDIKPPPYDPEQAKKLLAEAGYPKGFRIALHGPNDRYVNDAKIIQAIGQMWTRIGVQTEVDPLPWSSYVGQANKQAFSAFLFGWGTGTAEASDPLIAQNATFDPAKGWGASNRGRYSNPELDKLIGEALGTADDAAREKILQQAQRMAFDDVAIIPLHIQKNIWATRAGLHLCADGRRGSAAGRREAGEVSRAAPARPPLRTYADVPLPGREGGDAAMLAYHDREWGVPHHDDRALFELLTLEGAQAGLSWRTILARRDEYRRAYHGFDIARVAGMRDAALEKLLTTSGIIRNRLKVYSVRDNARMALDVIAEHGSLDAYLWSFVDGKPVVNRWQDQQGGAGEDRAVRPDEQDAGQARLSLCRLDHMLCLHAGDRNGERPPGQLLQIQGVRPCRTLSCRAINRQPPATAASTVPRHVRLPSP